MRDASTTPSNSSHEHSISGFRRRPTKRCASGVTTKFLLTSLDHPEFRTDVIVTRFSPEDQKTMDITLRRAILAREAFSAAADPNRFPEQLGFREAVASDTAGLEHVAVLLHQPQSSIRSDRVDGFGSGGYNPLLGKAYTEIAAASISMHKSQGVGGPPRRGARKEYFKPLEGQPMTSSLFDDVDTTWARVPNSGSVAAEIRQIISKFDPTDPAGSVPELLKLRQAMSEIHDDSWIPEKRAQLDEIIAACLGLHVEASTGEEAVTPGQTAAYARSNQSFEYSSHAAGSTISHLRRLDEIDAALPFNELVKKDLSRAASRRCS